ncbi:MAG: GNAT family N-acetyltransferase [Kiritimatiellae bacterium]|nr:GNAT family N-acetyltransferase [Kiritimatiellia bacterium]
MLQAFHESNLPELKQWWEVGVEFVQAPTDKWAQYVCENDNVHGFCSIENERITAYSQTDVENGTGHISIVTNPLLCRRGFGTKHLRELEELLPSLGVNRLVASIEVENAPSIAFFQKHGYTRNARATEDPDFVVYEKSIQPRSAGDA